MPATATPRKPQTLARKLVETRNTSRNRSLAAMLGLGESEKELARDFGSGLNDVIGRGTLASLIGLPGDLGGLAENGIRSALGMPQIQPYGGSEHIGQKLEEAGLVSPVRRPKTELLASLISPSQAASAAYRAPQMARAGVRMLDNLAAPRTMGSQTGAIENLWHGSPHTFDRFDLSKIGTGEGAQAYGHGAYLAESKGVADSYRRGLTNRELQNLAADSYDQFDSGDDAFQAIISNPSLSESQRNLISALKDDDWLGFDYPHQAIGEVLKNPGAWDLSPKTQAALSDTGNLYQTRLAWPDPAREATDPLSPDHFLYWDKPLSEQAAKDKVVQAFKARGFDDWQIESMLNRGITGEQANVYLGGINGSETGAKSLLDAGVPGIRYLDAGSRGAGAGSHNYVVFDDSLIDIVSRNGQPVGNLGKMVAPQDEALRVAQQNAAKPIEEGGLGLRPDNTPEERAAAMGYNIDGYHGTNTDIPAFDNAKAEDGVHWFATHPDKGGQYAKMDRDGANVLPLRIRLDNPAGWEQADGRTLQDFSRLGYDGAYLPDGDLTTGFVTNPNQFRSRFAAFDPMRRDSSDILAGLAPIGLGAWMYQDEPVK